ncbi:MAG: hypothetical protein MK105_10730 [Crocinitomicaceae bacterium]|nr:hypothetical protein [Crocinitomicaceae bacterium]
MKNSSKRKNLKVIERDYRLQSTKDILREQQLTGLLNNSKWLAIFETIQGLNCRFRIKLLTDTEVTISNSWSQEIIELEKHEFLSENYEDYGFIEFKEIQRIDIELVKFSEELKKEFEALGDVEVNENMISIYGYWV